MPDRGHVKRPNGVELIARERVRQVQVEGWTPTHDAGHNDGDLALAAVCYIESGHLTMVPPPDDWPWEPEWWKPSEDRIRNLVKAGALIAAEIDRRQAMLDAGVRY